VTVASAPRPVSGVSWLSEARFGPAEFDERHRLLAIALWLHLPALVAIAVLGRHGGVDLSGTSPGDEPVWQIWALWGQILVASASAALADLPVTRRGRSLLVSTGFLFVSTALVQASGGLPEMHAYCLVLVALIGLYQDWVPFLGVTVAISLHHALLGRFAPDLLFAVDSGAVHAVTAAILHAGLVVVMAAVQMTYWWFAVRSARALAASSAEAHRLAMVARHTTEGVAITDVEGRIEWVNDAFIRMSGRTFEEVVGRRRIDLFHGTSGHLEDLAETFAEAGQGMDAEVATFTGMGRQCWLDVEVRPVPGPDGVEHLVWLERDITARHLAEAKTQAASRRAGSLAEALSAEKSLLTGVISTIPYFVYWKDAQLRYRGANAAYLAVRGIDTELDLATRQEEQLAGEDPLDRLRESETQVLSRGEPILDRALKLTAPDGSVRTLTVSVLPHRAPTGAVDGVIGVGADVSHVTELERQLAQANRLETIGQVAAGIAHEINTPVQFVSDNTRFVSEVIKELYPALRTASDLADDLHRHLQNGEGEGNVLIPGPRSRSAGEIAGQLRDVLGGVDAVDTSEEMNSALVESLEGLDRVAKIVRAMKEFSHPGEDLVDTDLNRAVESTVHVCRNEWKYVADLDLDLDPELGPVPCFAGELQQVILNMIVNASHAIAERQEHGDPARGSIRLATRREGDTVRITIADDGIGMPAEVASRAFDPFFTTKPLGKGTGQGLALARSCVVGRHDGTIDVTSAPGEGTTFTIALPAVR
jgi:two-component system, NtrC family, sensor kinase